MESRTALRVELEATDVPFSSPAEVVVVPSRWTRNSVLTMVLTPLLIQVSPKVARRVEAVQRVRHWFPGKTAARLAQAESRHLTVKDHVIIVGYGLNGRNLARVLSETEIPYVALDLDGEKVRREAKNGVSITQIACAAGYFP